MHPRCAETRTVRRAATASAGSLAVVAFGTIAVSASTAGVTAGTVPCADGGGESTGALAVVPTLGGGTTRDDRLAAPKYRTTAATGTLSAMRRRNAEAMRRL